MQRGLTSVSEKLTQKNCPVKTGQYSLLLFSFSCFKIFNS